MGVGQPQTHIAACRAAQFESSAYAVHLHAVDELLVPLTHQIVGAKRKALDVSLLGCCQLSYSPKPIQHHRAVLYGRPMLGHAHCAHTHTYTHTYTHIHTHGPAAAITAAALPCIHMGGAGKAHQS